MVQTNLDAHTPKCHASGLDNKKFACFRVKTSEQDTINVTEKLKR